jgi:hypothetical protein
VVLYCFFSSSIANHVHVKKKRATIHIMYEFLFIVVLLGVFAPSHSWAQFVQQGNKLVGTGYDSTTYVQQGTGCSISSDGTLIASGGTEDTERIGAVWLFSRSGTSWNQTQAKLVGLDWSGLLAYQGYSIDMSSNGSTIVFGGYGDGINVGAAWVFIRNGLGVWVQLQPKLVGTGYSGIGSCQGWSVAISSDASTIAVGGQCNNGNIGATWMYTRNATGYYNQRGSFLIGNDYVGTAGQGSYTALSADGSTLAVGGGGDNNQIGAVWVYVKNATGYWEQQGPKLLGSDYVGNPVAQCTVSISEDGNTLAFGGPYDNGGFGAVWIFTRTNGTWSQQGLKLTPNDVTGTVIYFGSSTSLSADGNYLVVGGNGDNSNVGATWLFTRSDTTWNQYGSKTTETGSVGASHIGGCVSISKYSPFYMVAGGYWDNNYIGAAWPYALTPTQQPTGSPSRTPSIAPTTSQPTMSPTTSRPSTSPTISRPSHTPTDSPTVSPTAYPTSHHTSPTAQPSSAVELVAQLWCSMFLLGIIVLFLD